MKLVETLINKQGKSQINSINKPQSWDFPGDLAGHKITDLFFSKKLLNMTYLTDKPPGDDFNLKPGQIRFFVNEVPPTKPVYTKLKQHDPALKFEKLFYHNTTTVDYIYVIDGPITLVVGEDKVDLETGDTAIQRGTAHAWHNYSDKVAKFVIVMVGVEPTDEFKQEVIK